MWNTASGQAVPPGARCRMATMPRCSRPRSSAGRSRRRPIRSWRASRSPGCGEDAHAREVLGRPEVLPVASRVLGFSTAASDLLVRHPEEVEALAMSAPGTERSSLRSSRTTRRRTAPPPASAGSAGGRCSASPPATSTARPSRRSSPRSATWPMRVSRTPAPTATRSSRSASSADAELNYASDVDLLLLHREDVGGDIAETEAANLIADLLRPHLRGRRAPRRPHAPPGWPRRPARPHASRPRSPTTSARPPPGSARR